MTEPLSPAHPFPLPDATGELPIVDSHLFTTCCPRCRPTSCRRPSASYLDPFVGVTDDGSRAPGSTGSTMHGERRRRRGGRGRRLSGSSPPAQRRGAADGRPGVAAVDERHPDLASQGHAARAARPGRPDRALAVIEASLSPAGYASVRAAMALNAHLGELIDDYRDTLTEFAYSFTVFGRPSSDAPWGWRLMGHHVDLHYVFVGGQVVLAPVFLGAEPTTGTGRFDGSALSATRPRPDSRPPSARSRPGAEVLLSRSLRAGPARPSWRAPGTAATWRARQPRPAGRGIIASSLTPPSSTG